MIRSIGSIISFILCSLFAIMAIVSTPVAIGYGIYLWAHELQLPQAAWQGFVLWLKMWLAFIPAVIFWLIGEWFDGTESKNTRL